MEDSVNGFLTSENVDEYAETLINFLNAVTYKNDSFISLVNNAYQSALKYREEEVALKAVHYYNNLIAEKVQERILTWNKNTVSL